MSIEASQGSQRLLKAFQRLDLQKGWTDGWMDRWVDGQMGGWMDGWMDRWMNGQMGVRTDPARMHLKIQPKSDIIKII